MLGMPYPLPSPPVLSPTCSGKTWLLGLAFGHFIAPTPLPVTALPRHCSPLPSLSASFFVKSPLISYVFSTLALLAFHG